MAPTKEKAKKSTAEEGSAMVLDYLRQQNRPYSATDISANLHNKVSKPHVAKYLKELKARNEIEEKLAGKQAVYHSLQDISEASTTDELAALEVAANILREEVATAKFTEKALKSSLSALSIVTSAEELKSTIEALFAQKQGLTERLTELKKVEVKPVSEQEKAVVEEEHKKWTNYRNSRKEVFKSLWLQFLEVKMDGEAKASKQDLWEELGCDGEMP